MIADYRLSPAENVRHLRGRNRGIVTEQNRLNLNALKPFLSPRIAGPIRQSGGVFGRDRVRLGFGCPQRKHTERLGPAFITFV